MLFFFFPSLMLFIHFLYFLYGSLEQQNPHKDKLSFKINATTDLLAGIEWPVCILKPQSILCVLFYKTDSGLLVWSNFYLSHNPHCITFYSLSCIPFAQIRSIRLSPDYRPIAGTVFANDQGDQGSIPGWVISTTQKWYLMPPCLILSIIRYGLRVSEGIQGKEWRPPLHLDVVAIEKRAFGSASITVGQFTFISK